MIHVMKDGETYCGKHMPTWGDDPVSIAARAAWPAGDTWIGTFLVRWWLREATCSECCEKAKKDPDNACGALTQHLQQASV